MLNLIWFGMILLSFAAACVLGRLDELSAAVMQGAEDAVELSIFLMGSMCAWLGFLKIASRSGLTELFSRVLSPIIGRLFPEYKSSDVIKGKICMNITANILGLGNAATPLGLSAMEEMQKKNRSERPTNGMVLFVVLNTVSLQLLPVNIAAIRSSAGSSEPFSILPHIWLSSLAAAAGALLLCKFLEKRERFL